MFPFMFLCSLYIFFPAAPGLEEMRHVYDNLRVSNAMSVANTNISTFERHSSIRNSSKRAQTLASMSSLYVEEDVVKNLEAWLGLLVQSLIGCHFIMFELLDFEMNMS